MTITAAELGFLNESADILLSDVGVSETEIAVVDAGFAAQEADLAGENPVVAATESLLVTAGVAAVLAELSPALIVGGVGDALLDEGEFVAAEAAAQADLAINTDWSSLPNGSALIAKTTYTIFQSGVETTSALSASLSNLASMLGNPSSVSTSEISGPIAVMSPEAIIAMGETVNVDTTDTVAIFGGGNTINAVADSTIADVSYGGDTINAATGDVVSIAGNGTTGTDNIINANGSYIALGPQSRADVYGSNDTISVASSSEIGVTGTGDTLTAQAGVGIWLNGGGDDTVNGLFSDGVTLDGNGKTGDDYIVNMTNGVVVEGANARADVVGSNDTVSAAADSEIGVTGRDDTLTAAADDGIWLKGGGDDTVNAAIGDGVTLEGNRKTGDDYIVNMTGGVVVEESDARADIVGSNDTVVVAAGSGIGITGAGDKLTADADDWIWLKGGGDDTVNAAIGDSVSLNGNGKTGDEYIVNMSGGAIAEGSNARADVIGSNDSVSVAAGSEIGVNGTDDTLTAGADDGIWLKGGGNDTVNAANGDGVTLDGNGETGDEYLVNISGGAVAEGSDARADVYGSDDAISVAAGSEIGVTGSGDTLDAGGDDGIWLKGGGNDTINTATGKGVSVSLNGNGKTGDDYVVNMAGGAIAEGSNSRADIVGANDTISVAAGSEIGIVGSYYTLTASADDGIWLNGGGKDTVYAASGDTIFVLNGSTEETIYASGDNIQLGSVSSVNIVGNDDTITSAPNDTGIMISGADDSFTGDIDTVSFIGPSSAGDTISGIGDTATTSNDASELAYVDALQGVSGASYSGTYNSDQTPDDGTLKFNFIGGDYNALVDEYYFNTGLASFTLQDITDNVSENYNAASRTATFTLNGNLGGQTTIAKLMLADGIPPPTGEATDSSTFEINGQGSIDISGTSTIGGAYTDSYTLELAQGVALDNTGTVNLLGATTSRSKYLTTSEAAIDINGEVVNESGAVWDDYTTSNVYSGTGSYDNEGTFAEGGVGILNVNVVNNGVFDLSSSYGALYSPASLTFDDAVSGVGTVDLAGLGVTFAASVSTDEIVDFVASAQYPVSGLPGSPPLYPTLEIDDPKDFGATISNFDQGGVRGDGDQIVVNAAGWQYQDFVSNSLDGGSLIFTDGTMQASLSMTGTYDPTLFHSAISGSQTTITYG